MTKTDIDTIIKTICPNDEDFEKPIISPAYLKKELEALALEQEPYEDTISQKIDEFELKGKPAEIWIVKGKLQVRYLGIIHNVPLPPVTPKPRTGKWKIYVDCEGKTRRCVCDQCGNETDKYTWKNPNFCENCGAKMEGGSE